MYNCVNTYTKNIYLCIYNVIVDLSTQLKNFIHFGLVIPIGDIDVGQHWFGWRFVAT